MPRTQQSDSRVGKTKEGWSVNVCKPWVQSYSGGLCSRYHSYRPPILRILIYTSNGDQTRDQKGKEERCSRLIRSLPAVVPKPQLWEDGSPKLKIGNHPKWNKVSKIVTLKYQKTNKQANKQKHKKPLTDLGEWWIPTSQFCSQAALSHHLGIRLHGRPHPYG